MFFPAKRSLNLGRGEATGDVQSQILRQAHIEHVALVTDEWEGRLHEAAVTGPGKNNHLARVPEKASQVFREALQDHQVILLVESAAFLAERGLDAAQLALARGFQLAKQVPIATAHVNDGAFRREVNQPSCIRSRRLEECHVRSALSLAKIGLGPHPS